MSDINGLEIYFLTVEIHKVGGYSQGSKWPPWKRWFESISKFKYPLIEV